MADLNLFQTLSKIAEGNFTLVNSIIKGTQETSPSKTESEKIKETILGPITTEATKKGIKEVLYPKTTTKKKKTVKSKVSKKVLEPKKEKGKAVISPEAREMIAEGLLGKTSEETPIVRGAREAAEETLGPFKTLFEKATKLTETAEEGGNLIKSVQKALGGLTPEEFLEYLEKESKRVEDEIKKHDDKYEAEVESYYSEAIKVYTKLLEETNKLKELLTPDEKKKMIRNLAFGLLSLSALIHPSQSAYFLASVPTILKSWEEDDEREFEKKLREWEIRMSMLQTIAQYNKEITDARIQLATLKHKLRTEDLRAYHNALLQASLNLRGNMVVYPKEAAQFIWDIYKTAQELKYKEKEIELKERGLELREKELEENIRHHLVTEALRKEELRIKEMEARGENPVKIEKAIMDVRTKIFDYANGIVNNKNLDPNTKYGLIKNIIERTGVFTKEEKIYWLNYYYNTIYKPKEEKKSWWKFW